MWTSNAANPPSMILRLQPDGFQYDHHKLRPARPVMSGRNRKASDVSCSVADDRSTATKHLKSSTDVGLRFDKLQIWDSSRFGHKKRLFGNFVAREAFLDEEFWTAAWLRAESNWEDHPKSRYENSYKKKFADQEFAALKRRCNGHNLETCTCIVAVKKERNNKGKQTVLKSIVGTLDINIRCLLQGEDFPQERGSKGYLKENMLHQTDKPRYAYIANVCVAKYARRQGIADNMLRLAVDASRTQGVDKIFVHVNKDNIAARNLYRKRGFEVVGTNANQNSNYLMMLIE